MRLQNIKYLAPFIVLVFIASLAFYFNNQPNKTNKSLGATVLMVPQGGTGRATFAAGQCLKGNGTGAIVTGACAAGGGITTVATGTPDTNLGMSIVSDGVTATFTPYWIGTLANNRIASSTDWNNKVSSQWTTVNATNISFNGTTTQANIKANSSAGINIIGSSGGIVANFAPGGGQAVSFMNGGSFANYLRVGGSAHGDSMFESMASTNDGSTGIFHGYNASATEVFALNSDGDIDIGVWKGTDIDISDYTNLSVTATGLGLSGDAIALSAGYEIPKTASTSNWQTAYLNRVDTWTSPLQYSGNTASILQSSSSTNGYLSSADWNIFNQKADASSVGNLTTMYHWNATSSVAGYEMFRTIPHNGVEVTEATSSVANTRLLIDSYISTTSPLVDGSLTFTSIPAGTWNFHTFAQTSNAAGTNVIIYDVYKRNSAGVETLLFTATSSALTTSVTELDYSYTYGGATSSSDGTDRLVMKVYAFSSINAHTITFYYDGNTHYSHVETPFTFVTRGYVRSFDNAVITGSWTFPSLTVNGVIGGSGGTSTNWNTAYNIVNASSSNWQSSYTSLFNSGSNGYILQTNGANPSWVSTSSLGIFGSSYWTATTSGIYYDSGLIGTPLMWLEGDLRLDGVFFDSQNSTGTANQILSSTGTSTLWVNKGFSMDANGNVVFSSGATTATMTKCMEINIDLQNPAAGDEVPFAAEFANDVLINQVKCISDTASTSPSNNVTLNFYKGNSNGTATSSLLTGGNLTCGNTNQSTSTSALLSAGQSIGFKIVSASGTPAFLHSMIKYCPN